MKIALVFWIFFFWNIDTNTYFLNYFNALELDVVKLKMKLRRNLWYVTEQKAWSRDSHHILWLRRRLRHPFVSPFVPFINVTRRKMCCIFCYTYPLSLWSFLSAVVTLKYDSQLTKLFSRYVYDRLTRKTFWRIFVSYRVDSLSVFHHLF